METNTTLQFIGTYLIPLITALAGWIAGSRKRNNNFLQALIRCDSTGRARLEEINTLKQTQAQHLHQTTQTQLTETIIEKQVNILKWWQKGLMWVGGLCILILLFRILRILG